MREVFGFVFIALGITYLVVELFTLKNKNAYLSYFMDILYIGVGAYLFGAFADGGAFFLIILKAFKVLDILSIALSAGALVLLILSKDLKDLTSEKESESFKMLFDNLPMVIIDLVIVIKAITLFF